MLPFVTILGRSLPMYGCSACSASCSGCSSSSSACRASRSRGRRGVHLCLCRPRRPRRGQAALPAHRAAPARGARALRLGGGGAARLRLRRLRVPRRRARRARGGMALRPGLPRAARGFHAAARARARARGGARARRLLLRRLLLRRRVRLARLGGLSRDLPRRAARGCPRLPCSSLRPPCQARALPRGCCGSRQGRGRARFAAEFYLACYCPARFLLEFFRGDDARGALWGLSTSQWLSAAGSLAVSLYFFMRSGRKMPD